MVNYTKLDSGPAGRWEVGVVEEAVLKCFSTCAGRDSAGLK